MRNTTLVHIDEERDVYIGRQKWKLFHYGNPFSHIPGKGIPSSSRAAAVDAYQKWLVGEDHGWVEPDRRLWILKNLKNLKGKRIACHCTPLQCHGDILINLINERE